MPLHSPLPESLLSFAYRQVELTCQELEKPKFDKRNIIPVENCFRFLDSYRYDAFNWRNAHDEENTFERVARETLQDTMRQALNKTGEVLFPEQGREEIAVKIQEVLALHYIGKHVDLSDAKKFFAQLLRELQTLMKA